jgi:hypothetical protein
MSSEHLFCLHEERWQELSKKLDRIEGKIDDHHKRIWIGNGSPALAQTLRDHDQILRIITWVVGTVSTAVIGIIVALIFKGHTV